MSLRRWTFGSAPLALALALAGASAASAQDRQLFEWRGRVDREADIVVRGRDVRTRYIGSNERDRDRTRVRSAMPREDGRVRVRVEDGRGDVDVVQQPDRRNDYTAIIRVRDRSGGHDTYRLAAYWEPDRYGWRDGRGGWDRGRGNDDRDRGGWDRGRGGWDRDGRDNRGGWDRDGRGGYGRGGRGILHWSGGVDDAVRLRIQGNRVDYFNVSGNGTRGVRSDFRGQPLRGGDDVRILGREGRGRVDVIQQPSARNGYTAVIQIRDPEGGFGYYDFDVVW